MSVFYDYAKWEFCFEMWMNVQRDPPERFDDEAEDLASIDRWTAARGGPRPDHVVLLRARDGLTGREMAVRLGGSPDQSVHWTGEWTLGDGTYSAR